MLIKRSIPPIYYSPGPTSYCYTFYTQYCISSQHRTLTQTAAHRSQHGTFVEGIFWRIEKFSDIQWLNSRKSKRLIIAWPTLRCTSSMIYQSLEWQLYKYFNNIQFCVRQNDWIEEKYSWHPDIASSFVACVYVYFVFQRKSSISNMSLPVNSKINLVSNKLHRYRTKINRLE